MEEKKYFAEIYVARDLDKNLKAFTDQGYEIVHVLPAGSFQDEALFLVIAKLINIE